MELNDGYHNATLHMVEGKQQPPFNLRLLEYYTFETEPCNPGAIHHIVSKDMFKAETNMAEVIILNSGGGRCIFPKWFEMTSCFVFGMSAAEQMFLKLATDP